MNFFADHKSLLSIIIIIDGLSTIFPGEKICLSVARGENDVSFRQLHSNISQRGNLCLRLLSKAEANQVVMEKWLNKLALVYYKNLNSTCPKMFTIPIDQCDMGDDTSNVY